MRYCRAAGCFRMAVCSETGWLDRRVKALEGHVTVEGEDLVRAVLCGFLPG